MENKFEEIINRIKKLDNIDIIKLCNRRDVIDFEILKLQKEKERIVNILNCQTNERFLELEEQQLNMILKFRNGDIN